MLQNEFSFLRQNIYSIMNCRCGRNVKMQERTIKKKEEEISGEARAFN